MAAFPKFSFWIFFVDKEDVGVAGNEEESGADLVDAGVVEEAWLLVDVAIEGAPDMGVVGAVGDTCEEDWGINFA